MNASLSAALDEMKVSFVTKEEHRPVQALVYGGTAFILLAVLGSVVALVVQGAR